MLYQLGEYNTKVDLCEQSQQIRNHITQKHDFESIKSLIDKYEVLEIESIIILKKAINAGYWNSIYGFNWKPIEELEFWKIIESKSNGAVISRLQLLRTLQSTGVQNIDQLKSDYIEILNETPSLYYELISEDLSSLWMEDDELKEVCIKAMFIHLSKDMTLIEFEDQVAFQTQKHYANDKIPILIEDTVNQIKNEKASNNGYDDSLAIAKTIT